MRTAQLGDLSLKDIFFKTFIDDYSPYDFRCSIQSLKIWYIYISEDENQSLKALLKLKIEGSEEDYFFDLLI